MMMITRGSIRSDGSPYGTDSTGMLLPRSTEQTSVCICSSLESKQSICGLITATATALIIRNRISALSPISKTFGILGSENRATPLGLKVFHGKNRSNDGLPRSSAAQQSITWDVTTVKRTPRWLTMQRPSIISVSSLARIETWDCWIIKDHQNRHEVTKRTTPRAIRVSSN